MFRSLTIVAAFGAAMAPTLAPTLATAQPTPRSAQAAIVNTSSAPAAAAAAWTVDPRASRVSVSEDTTGLSFSFDSWTADLRFDPRNLAGSSAVVTLQMASARSGDASNDATLRNDWIKARQHPTAVFRASSFRSLGGANFEAPGELTIQGRTHPVVFRFTAAITGNQANVTGTAQLDRAALGFTIDPQFDWVSRMVTVNVALRATRAG